MAQDKTIAILADSPARKTYLAEVAVLAGLSPVEGREADMFLAEEGADVAGIPPEKIMTVSKDEGPIRAAALIDKLRGMLRDQQKMPDRVMIAGNILDTVHNLWMTGEGVSPIRLTEKETDLLWYLKEKGAPASRDELLDQIWGYADDTETHTIETHIYRLRQKIEPDPSSPSILVTQDNGYALKDQG